MNAVTLWWIIAGFLFSAELLSRSLHFLALAVGAVVAAVAAGFGVGPNEQMLLATVIGGGLVFLRHLKLMRRSAIEVEGYHTTGLGDLDVGEQVCVNRWEQDGTAHVDYRGAAWPARHFGPHVPRSGPHRILAVENTHLVLEAL